MEKLQTNNLKAIKEIIKNDNYVFSDDVIDEIKKIFGSEATNQELLKMNYYSVDKFGEIMKNDILYCSDYDLEGLNFDNDMLIEARDLSCNYIGWSEYNELYEIDNTDLMKLINNLENKHNEA